MGLDGTRKLQPFWRLMRQVNAVADTVSISSPTSEDSSLGIVNVSSFNRIRIRVLGTAADNATGFVTLYGWHGDGTYATIADYSVTLGNNTNHDFTNALIWADPDIRAYLTGVVFEVDTYVENYDENGVGTIATAVTDGANYIEVDLAGGQYQWLRLVKGLTTATALGAVYIPVALRESFGPLDVR